MNGKWQQLSREFIADRRGFILAGASLGVLPWLNAAAVEPSSKINAFQGDPFTLGVASGDPSWDGFVLWTRLAPSPLEGGGLTAKLIEVTWELAEDESMQRPVRSGTAVATPQLGHSVHVELTGLQPDRWYWYRFRCGDAVSPTGKTRTCPMPEALPQQLRFAFVSCQNFEQGLYTGYQRMADEDLDLVVHLGDYIYEFAGKENDVRKHSNQELSSLEDYRNRYAQYRTDPWLQGMHARAPWLVVWDDHEVDNDYANDISEQAEVDREAFLMRRANAYQAYYEHMPLRRRSLPGGPFMKIYRTVPYGRLATFQMLDTRQYRTDQPEDAKGDPIVERATDPAATLLGRKQEHWLQGSLLQSQSEWNVLAQQVMMARVDRAPGAESRYSMDQWSGYEAARSRLLRFLADREVLNPIVLAGDIHSNWVNDLRIDFNRNDDPAVATEFVGTSISSGGNGILVPTHLKELLSENPCVRFHNEERGYVSCTVTPKEWRSDYQAIEYVDKPDAPKITRASFVVETGHPGAQRI